MSKTYRAKADFSCPADAENIKKRLAALKAEPGAKKDALLREVAWKTVKKGDKVVPSTEAQEKTWLERGLVEEVKN